MPLAGRPCKTPPRPPADYGIGSLPSLAAARCCPRAGALTWPDCALQAVLLYKEAVAIQIDLGRFSTAAKLQKEVSHARAKPSAHSYPRPHPHLAAGPTQIRESPATRPLHAGITPATRRPHARYTPVTRPLQIGELAESEGDLQMAMEAYQTAADYYAGEESHSSANQCLLKVRNRRNHRNPSVPPEGA